MSLKELNGKLTNQPYVAGYTPSKEDAATFKELFGSHTAVIQWAARMASYYQSERDEILNGGAKKEEKKEEKKKTVSPAAKPQPAPKKPAADDDVDLFGEETEEDKAAAAERKKKEEEAKKNKKVVIAKSSILLDVKVWDDTIDLEALAKKLKSNERDGLVWGAHKLVPVAFGVKKLQILMVIEDDKVSSEDIEDIILGYEDEVQSMDIVAWNKI